MVAKHTDISIVDSRGAERKNASQPEGWLFLRRFAWIGCFIHQGQHYHLGLSFLEGTSFLGLR